MIGGEDIFLETGVGNKTLPLAVKALIKHWPNACFHCDERDYESYKDISWDELERIYVYKDENSKLHWDELGWVEDVRNDMLFFIFGKIDKKNNSLSIVCDGVTGIEGILFDIQLAIKPIDRGIRFAMNYNTSIIGFLLHVLIFLYAYFWNPAFYDCAIIGMVGFCVLGWMQIICRKECIRLFLKNLNENDAAT